MISGVPCANMELIMTQQVRQSERARQHREDPALRNATRLRRPRCSYLPSCLAARLTA